MREYRYVRMRTLPKLAAVLEPSRENWLHTRNIVPAHFDEMSDFFQNIGCLVRDDCCISVVENVETVLKRIRIYRTHYFRSVYGFV